MVGFVGWIGPITDACRFSSRPPISWLHYHEEIKVFKNKNEFSKSHFNPFRFWGRTIYIFVTFKSLFVCLDVFPYLCKLSAILSPCSQCIQHGHLAFFFKKKLLRQYFRINFRNWRIWKIIILTYLFISDVLCGIFDSSFLSCYNTSWSNCRWRQSSNWPIPIHCELFSSVQETLSANSGFFFSKKNLKYGKPRLGESTLT